MLGALIAPFFAQTVPFGHIIAATCPELFRVTVPTMVVMGEQDPDFPDAAQEARWIGEQLQARVEMISDAGHYPHAQQADVVNALLVDFLQGATHHA